jgi:hypothetical protein
MKKSVVTVKNQTWNSERDEMIRRIIRSSGYRSQDVTALLGLSVNWDTSPESDRSAWETFETWSNLLGLAKIRFERGPRPDSIMFVLPRTSSREDEEVILIFPETERIASKAAERTLEQRVDELEKITMAMAAILVNDGRASWVDSPAGAEQGPFIVQGFDFPELQVRLDEIFRKFVQ